MKLFRIIGPVAIAAAIIFITGCSGRSHTVNPQDSKRAETAWKTAGPAEAVQTAEKSAKVPATDRNDPADSKPEVSAPPQHSVHSEFSLGENDIDNLITFLPVRIQENIRANEADFLKQIASILDLPEALTVLVDKQHALSEDFIPTDLVELSDYSLLLNRSGLQLRKIVLPDLMRMVEAARKDGIKLLFLSSYRSYEYQDTVYSREVRLYGKEVADRESAQPGKSQHQLGTVTDIGSLEDDFDTTPAGIWLMQHAWEYGFSLSYPKNGEALTGYKYEPWHYRYLTPLAAAFERKYFDGIQQYFLEFLSRSKAALAAAGSGGASR